MSIGDVFSIDTSPNFDGFVDYITDGDSGNIWSGSYWNTYNQWSGTGWREAHIFWNDEHIANDLKEVYEVNSAQIEIISLEYYGDVYDSLGRLMPSYVRSQISLTLFGNQIGPLPQPIHESSTIILLGTGLAGLFGFRRKLKRRNI